MKDRWTFRNSFFVFKIVSLLQSSPPFSIQRIHIYPAT